MAMYQPGQRVEFHVFRNEANFDRACDEARTHANITFGCNEDGHLKNVTGSDRSKDSVVIEFVSYRVSVGMSGHCHQYRFSTFVDRYIDEEDEATPARKDA